MQTLSEFYSNWNPGIRRQAREIAGKVEAGQNMSRFLLLEPGLRSEVDALCRAYSESLSGGQYNPPTFEIGYLFSLRLTEADGFAQFLEHSGLGSAEMDAEDWLEFFLIDSWHEILVYKWR